MSGSSVLFFNVLSDHVCKYAIIQSSRGSRTYEEHDDDDEPDDGEAEN